MFPHHVLGLLDLHPCPSIRTGIQARPGPGAWREVREVGRGGRLVGGVGGGLLDANR